MIMGVRPAASVKILARKSNKKKPKRSINSCFLTKDEMVRRAKTLAKEKKRLIRQCHRYKS